MSIYRKTPPRGVKDYYGRSMVFKICTDFTRLSQDIRLSHDIPDIAIVIDKKGHFFINLDITLVEVIIKNNDEFIVGSGGYQAIAFSLKGGGKKYRIRASIAHYLQVDYNSRGDLYIRMIRGFGDDIKYISEPIIFLNKLEITYLDKLQKAKIKEYKSNKILKKDTLSDESIYYRF